MRDGYCNLAEGDCVFVVCKVAYSYDVMFGYACLFLVELSVRSTITTDRSCPKFVTDGMDQAKTNLPNTKIIAKSTTGLWHLRTHVTGVLAHTKADCGKVAFAYIHLLQWPHDSNLTITVLLDFVQLLWSYTYLRRHNSSETSAVKVNHIFSPPISFK